MKKLLVIADLGQIDPGIFLNVAIGSQQLPSDVTKLADNSWLIDAHKSLRFFAELVNSAQKYKCRLIVLPTDDEVIYVTPRE